MVCGIFGLPVFWVVCDVDGCLIYISPFDVPAHPVVDHALDSGTSLGLG
jgi:hypothetical protein